MSVNIKNLYFCDGCTAVALPEEIYHDRYNDTIIYIPPKDWHSIGPGIDLCPTCSKLFISFLDHTDNEGGLL